MGLEHSTLVGMPVVVAPGKLFLVGEYAVLEEAPAVVAAVNRLAVAQFVPGMRPASTLVEEAVARAKAGMGDAAAALPSGSVLVDTDDFSQNKKKLGLGSSAATAAAAVGAILECAGTAIEFRREEVLALALAAHRAAQGGAGSGADVAAAVYGGLIEVVRDKTGTPTVEALPIPSGLRVVVFWTGDSVATPRMLDGMQAFAKARPSVYRDHIESLREIAVRFVAELRAGSATGAVTAAARYGQRLAQLGESASLPIVTTAFARAAELAKELGGAAKPSGAGGGDIGVAMFATPEAARLFARALPKPLVPLALDLDRRGVRKRVPGEPAAESSGLFHG